MPASVLHTIKTKFIFCLALGLNYGAGVGVGIRTLVDISAHFVLKLHILPCFWSHLPAISKVVAFCVGSEDTEVICQKS